MTQWEASTRALNALSMEKKCSWRSRSQECLIGQNESDDPIQEITLIGLESAPCNHLPGCARDCVLWVQSNTEFVSRALSRWASYVCL